MTRVTIHLTFNVTDEKKVRELAEEGAEACWNSTLSEIVDTQNLGEIVMEAMLNSNPGVPAYDDLGLELITWTTETTKEN